MNICHYRKKGARAPRVLMLLLVFLWPVAQCVACTLCDTGTGDQVRQQLLQAGLLRNLAGLLAPVVVLLGIVAAIYFRFPSGLRGAGRPGPDE